MLAALAGVLGRGAAAEGGTYALAKGGGGPPPVPGAASQSKKAADALLSVSSNLDKTEKNAKKAKDAGVDYAGHLKNVQGAYQQSAGVLQVITGKIEGMGLAVTGALTGGIIALQAIADPIAQLTGLAAPAALEAFTRAVNDDFAVVGRALLPITEALTRAMEKFGVYLAGAEPILNTMSRAFGKMTDQLGDSFLSLLQESGPLLEAMATGLTAVAWATTKMVSGLAAVATWIEKVNNRFASLIGVNSHFDKNASAKGAAVRDVTVQTSAEKISNDAQASALRQALNPGKAAAKEPAEIQLSIYELLADFINNKCPTKKDLVEFLNGLPSKLAEGTRTGISSTVEAASFNPITSLIRSMLTR
jgi:hypothetical protein